MFYYKFFYAYLTSYICSHENVRWTERVDVVVNDACQHHKTLTIQFLRAVGFVHIQISLLLKSCDKVRLDLHHPVLGEPILCGVSVSFGNMVFWP